jgi:hypothetical protein
LPTSSRECFQIHELFHPDHLADQVQFYERR